MPAFAQRTAEDAAKEAQLAERAKKDAAALKAAEAASTVQALTAMAPITPDNIWVLDSVGRWPRPRSSCVRTCRRRR